MRKKDVMQEVTTHLGRSLHSLEQGNIQSFYQRISQAELISDAFAKSGLDSKPDNYQLSFSELQEVVGRARSLFEVRAARLGFTRSEIMKMQFLPDMGVNEVEASHPRQ